MLVGEHVGMTVVAAGIMTWVMNWCYCRPIPPQCPLPRPRQPATVCTWTCVFASGCFGLGAPTYTKPLKCSHESGIKLHGPSTLVSECTAQLQLEISNMGLGHWAAGYWES